LYRISEKMSNPNNWKNSWGIHNTFYTIQANSVLFWDLPSRKVETPSSKFSSASFTTRHLTMLQLLRPASTTRRIYWKKSRWFSPTTQKSQFLFRKPSEENWSKSEVKAWPRTLKEETCTYLT
jgi:hypothetical protein